MSGNNLNPIFASIVENHFPDWQTPNGHFEEAAEEGK